MRPGGRACAASLIAVDSPAALRHRLFGMKVTVQIANLSEAHRQAVAGLPFVKPRGSADRQAHSLLVELEAPEDNNPALVAALVGAGAQVQFVQPSEASLEDVYMQLVNGGEALAAEKGK